MRSWRYNDMYLHTLMCICINLLALKDSLSNHWKRDCLFKLFRLTARETSKFCISGPLRGESMPTVWGQEYAFLTHERIFLWKRRSFWDRKCFDPRGTRTANIRVHTKCCNQFGAIHQTFHILEHWLLQYSYFVYKYNIWYVNCVRIITVIFDSR